MRLMKWPEKRANGWLFWGGYKPKGSRVAQQKGRKEGRNTGWPRQHKTKTRDESKTKAKGSAEQAREMLIICGGFVGVG